MNNKKAKALRRAAKTAGLETKEQTRVLYQSLKTKFKKLPKTLKNKIKTNE